jgi:homeodomain-containing protein
MEDAQRFKGLKLSKADRTELRRRSGAGQKFTARVWRRMQTLLMLDRGMTLRATAAALGTYGREVSRVARRYLAKGLEHALSEEPRPNARTQRKLDSSQQAALVALACGPPPQGRSRWTLRLLAAQAVRRGVVDSLGYETVRVVLAEHKLKPWREKNVVRAGAQRPVH